MHQRGFDEDLYYVLLRLAQPRDAEAVVQQLLGSSGIQHHISYVVLGAYDSLLRFWATRAQHQRLVRTATLSSEIAEIREMKVTGIRWAWYSDENLLDLSTTDRVDAARERHAHDIEQAAAYPDHVEPIVIERLKSAGLVIEKGPDHAVKAITLLQPLNSTAFERDWSSKIVSGMKGFAGLRNLSLYVGEGNLASYLLRYTVSSVAGLNDSLDHLDAVMAGIPLRTSTIIMRRLVGLESDHTNNAARLEANFDRLIDDLKLEPNSLSALTPDSRRAANAFVSASKKQLNGDLELREMAFAIIRACIYNDSYSLRRELSFIMDFEFLLREFARIYLQDAYGENWIEKVRVEVPDVFKNLRDQDREDPTRWPLGVVHQILVDASRRDEYLKASISSALGTDWTSVSRGVLSLRNPYAHGNLGRQRDLSDLTGEWQDQVALLVLGLQMYGKLRHIVEKGPVK